MERLESAVVPRTGWLSVGSRPSPSNREFEGEISGESFVLQQGTRYPQRSIVLAEGKVRKDATGTAVALRLKLHPLVFWVVTPVYAGLVVLFFYWLVLLLIRPNEYPASAVLVLPIILVVAALSYSAILVAFKSEARMARGWMAEVVDGVFSDTPPLR